MIFCDTFRLETTKIKIMAPKKKSTQKLLILSHQLITITLKNHSHSNLKSHTKFPLSAYLHKPRWKKEKKINVLQPKFFLK